MRTDKRIVADASSDPFKSRQLQELTSQVNIWKHVNEFRAKQVIKNIRHHTHISTKSRPINWKK